MTTTVEFIGGPVDGREVQYENLPPATKVIKARKIEHTYQLFDNEGELYYVAYGYNGQLINAELVEEPA